MLRGFLQLLREGLLSCNSWLIAITHRQMCKSQKGGTDLEDEEEATNYPRTLRRF